MAKPRSAIVGEEGSELFFVVPVDGRVIAEAALRASAKRRCWNDLKPKKGERERFYAARLAEGLVGWPADLAWMVELRGRYVRYLSENAPSP